jgi:hypothetical protein
MKVKAQMPQSEKAAQHARFIETAKALECDEDEARFKEKLGKIAKAKIPIEKPASRK